ncbi:MAG: NYN domain-containing protein [Streptosporangiaceae bacterium]
MPSQGGSQVPPPTVMAFVDAGYLVAGARKRLKLANTPRINGDQLFLWASHAWTSRLGGVLLRAYLYDAAYPGDAAEYADQRAYFDQLGTAPNIRLRLGHLVRRAAGSPRAAWQQKGVDTLLVLDLVRMAQQRAFDTAMVVAGDRDLAEALRIVADDYARRVVLYSVDGSEPAMELRQVADEHGVIGDNWLHMIFSERTIRPAPGEAADAGAPGQP